MLMPKKQFSWGAVLIIGAAALLLVLLIPGLRSRAEGVWLRLRAAIFPVNEQVFIPAGTTTPLPIPTAQILLPDSPRPTASPTSTPTILFTPTPQTIPPPATPTPTALPPRVQLSGLTYQTQHGYWNYCAPANLFMALSYWGWQGKVTDIAEAIKPGQWDKNVMPYELTDYVVSTTNLSIVVRSGGNIALLKTLVAAGFPVIIEKGVILEDLCTGGNSWMGHYQTIIGYNDASQVIIAMDSYTASKEKPTVAEGYDTLQDDWRAFNYIFMVIYPPEREAELMSLLGPYADPAESDRIAAEIAAEEAATLQGRQRFFALFNRGTSLYRQGDYGNAALAYDEAFRLYAELPKPRPHRMMWYQTGPYFAYFNTGRFQDVIDLATTTLSGVCTSSYSKPGLEESWIWRARAQAALGNTDAAVSDLRQALEYHPNYGPALDLAAQLGVQP